MFHIRLLKANARYLVTTNDAKSTKTRTRAGKRGWKLLLANVPASILRPSQPSSESPHKRLASTTSLQLRLVFASLLDNTELEKRLHEGLDLGTVVGCSGGAGVALDRGGASRVQRAARSALAKPLPSPCQALAKPLPSSAFKDLSQSLGQADRNRSVLETYVNATLTSHISKPHTSNATYSIRSLMYAVTLIAWILGVNSWLGNPYGWLTAMPLVIGLPIYLTAPQTCLGAVVGFIAFAVFGDAYLIGWEVSEPEYLPSVATVGAYGSTVGCSSHAWWLGKRMMAWIVCVLTLITFVVVLQY